MHASHIIICCVSHPHPCDALLIHQVHLHHRDYEKNLEHKGAASGAVRSDRHSGKKRVIC